MSRNRSAVVALTAALLAACSGNDGDPTCEEFNELEFQVDGYVASAVANQHYDADESWTTSEMLSITAEELGVDAHGMDIDFFEDGSEGDRRPIKSIEDMSDSELEAYNAWLNSDLVGDNTGYNHGVTSGLVTEAFESLEDDAC